MNEFGIMPCPLCRRTPSVKKLITEDWKDPKRYVISCCQQVVYASGETPVIVAWNKEVAKKMPNDTAV